MWVWNQSNGNLAHNGQLVTTGYSGANAGKDNPDMESVSGVGPIPRGKYTIGAPYESSRTGPVTMPLHPTPDTNTFGRGGFLIHGDSIEHPGAASHGCIIIGRAFREAIAASGDNTLEVV